MLQRTTLGWHSGLRHQRVLELINGLDVPPTTATVPMRILRLQRDRTSSTADFAAALMSDQALCSKVLGLANSSYFSPRKPVRKLSDAIAMIGLNNVLSLVFSMSLAGIFSKLGLPPSDVKALWRNSLLKSLAAQEYARMFAPGVEEEAGLCGLLQDIALPVMHAADRAAWSSYVACLNLPDLERTAQERELFQLDHAEFGAMLCKQLSLPQLFCAATGAHHENAALERAAGSLPLARCCQFAAAMPHRDDQAPSVARLQRCVPAAALPQQERTALTTILGNVAGKYQRLLKMLGDNEDETTAFKEFLQQVTNEVARCLGSAIGESAAKIQNLESRELDLQKQIKALEDAAMKSDYDGLTELLNRQGWLRRTAHLFGLCQKHQTGCALGFLDIDSFKSINDTRGHDAGDAVLVKVAQSLQQVLGNHGVAGRLGGDEFVFALIAKDEAEAQTIVEQLQAAIKVQEIEIRPAGAAPPAPPVHVTTSIGSFWMGIPSPQLAVDAALKAADELMYQAKKSGKARCAFGRLKTAA